MGAAKHSGQAQRSGRRFAWRGRCRGGCALKLRPQLLLLDEPTSALDASVRVEVLNLLSRLREERGLTFLMVSHDLAVIDHMCDPVLVMQTAAPSKNGRARRWPVPQ